MQPDKDNIEQYIALDEYINSLLDRIDLRTHISLKLLAYGWRLFNNINTRKKAVL